MILPKFHKHSLTLRAQISVYLWLDFFKIAHYLFILSIICSIYPSLVLSILHSLTIFNLFVHSIYYSFIPFSLKYQSNFNSFVCLFDLLFVHSFHLSFIHSLLLVCFVLSFLNFFYCFSIFCLTNHLFYQLFVLSIYCLFHLSIIHSLFIFSYH